MAAYFHTTTVRISGYINRPEYINYISRDKKVSFDYPSFLHLSGSKWTECLPIYRGSKEECEAYSTVNFDQSSIDDRVLKVNEDIFSMSYQPRYNYNNQTQEAYFAYEKQAFQDKQRQSAIYREKYSSEFGESGDSDPIVSTEIRTIGKARVFIATEAQSTKYNNYIRKKVYIFAGSTLATLDLYYNDAPKNTTRTTRIINSIKVRP
ncbi:MAG: hypothetical protein ACSLEY_03260 [Candidatus Saccharimonadales bacterium]